MKKNVIMFIIFVTAACIWALPPESQGIDIEIKENSIVWNKFPIGIYWATKASLPEIRKYGFNYVIPIPEEIAPISAKRNLFYKTAIQYLDHAWENGLKCGFFIDNRDLQKYISGELSWEQIADAVRMLSDHPAFLFYYFRDEPENNPDSIISDPTFLQEFAAKIKSIDPYHPTFLVNCLPHVFPRYAEIPDIYSIDIYPVPLKPLTAVSDAVDRAFEANNWGSPVWFTVQGFGNTYYVPRSPSPTELRCMTYLSLIHEVSGIQFFRYCGDRWRALQPVNLWEEIINIVEELNILSPVLRTGIHLPQGQVSVDKEIDFSLIWYDDAVYLIAANRENRAINGKMKFGFFPENVTVLFEERELKGRENILEDYFEPYGVHIYKLENYFFLGTGIRGSRVQVGKPVTLNLFTSSTRRVEFSVNGEILRSRKKVNGRPAAGWIPAEWGGQSLRVYDRQMETEFSANLLLDAEYAAEKGVWHSYNVTNSDTAGQVSDGVGRIAKVEFYEALEGDLDAGRLFGAFNGESHPFVWNKVQEYWAPDSDSQYPYAGKKSSLRYVNRGNPSMDLPYSVNDLAIHPPCGSNTAVAAFVAPESGYYTVMGIGIKKSAVCGNPVELKVYDSRKDLITSLVSGGKWGEDQTVYDLSYLAKGNRIFFSVGSLVDCSCDFADIRWTIRREERY